MKCICIISCGRTRNIFLRKWTTFGEWNLIHETHKSSYGFQEKNHCHVHYKVSVASFIKQLICVHGSPQFFAKDQIKLYTPNHRSQSLPQREYQSQILVSSSEGIPITDPSLFLRGNTNHRSQSLPQREYQSQIPVSSSEGIPITDPSLFLRGNTNHRS